jgi:pimeloyl-ACP methyl ester carboxylesterase
MSKKVKKYKIPVKVPLAFRLIHKLFPYLEKFATPLANRIVAFLFFSPIRFKAPQKEKEVSEQAEKKIIISDGKKIQTYLWGEGPTVLMTHGWSGRGTQFRKFIKPFNDAGYQVVSFDGPAHGKSEGSNTNVTEFHDVIRQLEISNGPFAATIGHSFGGVANLYAHVRGVHTEKMIMIATPTISDDIIKESVRKLNGSPARGEYLKKYIYKRFGIHFEDVSVLKLMEEVNDTDLLAIHDVEDKDVPISHPEALLSKYPKANLIKTEGLGHLRILKSPDVVQHCLNYIKTSEVISNT